MSTCLLHSLKEERTYKIPKGRLYVENAFKVFGTLKWNMVFICPKIKTFFKTLSLQFIKFIFI